MRFPPCWRTVGYGLLLAASAWATSVPRLSFEELTDRSEVVASGEVTRVWSDWDASHKYIWTHHELTVASAYKGKPAARVVISEPGGVVGGLGMSIAGSVQYQAGDKVLVFLERMPNGYLRTSGWGQGQFRVDASGKIHGSESLVAVDLLPGSVGAARLESFEGQSLAQLAARVSARVRVQPAVVKAVTQ